MCVCVCVCVCVSACVKAVAVAEVAEVREGKKTTFWRGEESCDSLKAFKRGSERGRKVRTVAFL